MSKKPISYFVAVVEDIVGGSYSTRVSEEEAGELRELARAVNTLAEQHQIAQETIELLNSQLKRSNLYSIMALIEALNAKDPYTRSHCERVSSYSILIAKALQLSPEEVDAIYLASFLHDIGKIGVHENILNKASHLTDEEYRLVKSHADISSQIVSQIPNLTHLAPMVKHHHERHDGMGYPDGLKGDNIPLGARILSIADAFDAMTSSRPYRTAFKPKEALTEIKQRSGHQFDPTLATVFIDAYTRTFNGRIPRKAAS